MRSSIRHGLAIFTSIATFVIGIVSVTLFSIRTTGGPIRDLVPRNADLPLIQNLVVPGTLPAPTDIDRRKKFTGDELKLIRRHLDGQFSIEVPKIFQKPERPADVDGGYFYDNRLNINYNYWTYPDTPNFLRDRNGHYSKKPNLGCSENGVISLTATIILSGRRAYVQECRFQDPSDGFRYLYYVTFPKTEVNDCCGWGVGVFNIGVSYNDPKLRRVTKRIVESLRFDKK